MKSIEVVAAIILEDKNVLVTQRGYGEFEGLWEFPGGKIETSESHYEALVREIKEELLIDITVDKYLCTVQYDYPNFHLTMHCYICSIVSGEIKLLEHKSACWLSPDNLHSVSWLPADVEVIAQLQRELK